MDTLEIIEELKKKHPRRWVQTLSLLTDEMVGEIGFDSVKEFVFSKVSDEGLGLTEQEAESLIVFNLGTHRETSALEIAQTLGLKKFAEDVPVLGEPTHSGNQHTVGDKTENVTKHGSNSKDYRIAKLKRDFGENEVMEAIEDNGYTKASQVERHFGVGKQLLTPLEKVIRAYERLDDREKDIFMELTQKNAVVN